MGLAVRLWRHLYNLKRSGRGHATAGAAGTSSGELALKCPACPQSKKNLPDKWEKSSPDVLYVLYLSVDVLLSV